MFANSFKEAKTIDWVVIALSIVFATALITLVLSGRNRNNCTTVTTVDGNVTTSVTTCN